MRQLQSFLAHLPLLLFGGIFFAGSALLPTAPARGDVSIGNVQIGFEGAHKTGFWTPVWVTLTADGTAASGRLEITSADGQGVEVRSIHQGLFSLAAGETASVLRYVKTGRPAKGLTVECYPANGAVIRKYIAYENRTSPTDADAELVVSIGAEIGVATALALDATALNVKAIQVKEAARLPHEWFGYEGVDTLVITTFENRLLDQMTAAQATAIRQWVEMGGQCVLCIGDDGKRLLQDPANPAQQLFADLAPGKFARTVTVQSAAALENYTGGGQALQQNADLRLRMTVLKEVQGNTELSDVGVNGNRPMVIRAPRGFGQVVFVGFDLDQAPLSKWQGRPRMVVNIIRGKSAQENRSIAQQQSGQVSHVGYHDMVGQLRGALDQFDEVSFVAFSVVATLILVYILLIGPGDYFLLKKVLGRMPLTWVTFPIIVVAFVALAWGLKSQLKANRILVNQVDLIDVDADSGLLRGTTWAHVYSPVTEAYDVGVQPLVIQAGDTPPNSLLSWQGMPGAGLGGLNSTSATTAFARPYVVSTGQPAPIIAGLPIQIASTTPISSRWWQRQEWEQPQRLQGGVEDLLSGTVTNPLDVELRDCMIFFSNWVYYLERTRGRLAPGQTARVEDERPRDLKWRMTRREVQEMKDVATPWNPASLEVPRIMELMMFHKVAGGNQYTRLTHRYQDYVDLSSHLVSGRAVLIGRIEQRGSQVRVNGEAIPADAGKHWTFCRIVFPVDRSSFE